VAFEQIALRDGKADERPLLPPGHIVVSGTEQAPVEHDGSFLITAVDQPQLALDGREISALSGEPLESHLDYLKHPLYDRYMRLPKGLLAPEGVPVLREVYEGLADETAGRFLYASGWAAAEAALVMRGGKNGQKERGRLLEGASDSWGRAHDRMVAVAEAGTETNDHYSLKERVELVLATIPLLESIVVGDVKLKTLEEVTSDYLRVGMDNVAFSRHKRQAGDTVRATFHEGLSYEILALLGLNEKMSIRRFAVPSTARNDTGYNAARLTHDLMIFQQRCGVLRSMVPVEVKTRMSRHARRRYEALVVDGSVLDVPQAGEPGPMMDLFARVHGGNGSEAELVAADELAQNMWAMVAQYTSGERLKVNTGDAITRYHDASKVRLGGYALWGAARAA